MLIHHLHRILIISQVNDFLWCGLSSHTNGTSVDTLSPILRSMENEKVGLRR